MRLLLCILARLCCGCAGQLSASEVVGPRIDLSIERPLYVGLPVWLDVDVHDSCLEARYPTYDYPRWFGPLHEAEIMFGGGRAKRSGYHMGLIQFSGTVATGACPGERKIGLASRHRFPLHLIASFDQPGGYRVRWIVGRAGGGTPPMARSAWLSFNVLPSTASQRDAWLAGLLAHRPADPEALAGNYVLSLLAAWNDPRVTHELLTLVCSPDNRVAIPAADAVRVHIPPAEQLYIADLVEPGCMTDGVPRMIISDAMGLVGERPPVLQDDIRQIFWEVAAAHVLHGPAATVAPALTVMQWTYPSQLAEAGRIKAYRAVLTAGHAILTGTDQAAKSTWGAYMDRASTLPEMKRLLRRLAPRAGECCRGSQVSSLPRP